MDHDFVPTISGLCLRCRYPAVAHAPQYRSVLHHLPLRDEGRPDTPDSQTACPEDHSAVDKALLIGDSGLEWRRCKRCGILLEPKLATGEPTGQPWGKGRGELTARVMDRLQRWKGYILFLGGDGEP